MNISSVNAAAQAQAAASPTQAQTASAADQKKAAEAARQFEAVLLRQVLGDALKPGKGLGAKTPGADTYQSFVTDTLADNISQSSALGLSHLLQCQLPGGEAGKKC